MIKNNISSIALIGLEFLLGRKINRFLNRSQKDTGFLLAEIIEQIQNQKPVDKRITEAKQILIIGDQEKSIKKVIHYFNLHYPEKMPIVIGSRKVFEKWQPKEEKYLEISLPEISGWDEKANFLPNNGTVLADSIAENIYLLLALKEDIYFRDCSELEDFFSIQIPREKDQIKTIYNQQNCIFKLIYEYSPLDYVNGKQVGEIRQEMGKSLATQIPFVIKERVDFVSPVPQTGITYAMGLAEGLNKPYVEALIKPAREKRSFFLSQTDERKKLLWNKLIPLKEFIKGKKIALVDEAIFTGTTLKVVCEMLRECDVAEIHICLPTPPCVYECPYYVQPKRPLLLEYIRHGMLKDYFNVDSITFLKEKTFLQLKKELKIDCAECFLGEEK